MGNDVNNSDNGQSGAGIAGAVGQDFRHGAGIWGAPVGVSKDGAGIGGIANDANPNIGAGQGSARANAKPGIKPGFYWDRDGGIKPIPDGYYVTPKGKLRKRRSDARDNTATRDARGDRSEAGAESELDSDADLRPPLKVGRDRKKSATKEQAKITMVGALAGASEMFFAGMALATGHHHWLLEEQEAQILAKALDNALDTLPEKYYEVITKITNKWFPRTNLIWTIGAIVGPRLNASAERVKARNYQPPAPDNGRAESEHAGANNGFEYGAPGLGWSQ
jgi:hypothetical protein